MKESDQIDMVTKFLSGNLQGKDRADFLQWTESSAENKALFQEVKQVWELSEKYETPEFKADLPKSWEKVESRLDPILSDTQKAPKREAKIIKPSFGRQLIRIAAVFVIVSFAGWWLFNGNITNDPIASMVLVKTSLEEVKEITLPDGTQVWLNGESELAYDDLFESRKVELRGEAFFDVAREEGRPFEIYSGAAKTVVLGTAFNVRAYPRETKVEVAVVRGKVALVEEANPEKTVILEAGNAGVYKKAEKKVVKETRTKKNADSWKTKQLNFENAPLKEVLESLERHFNVAIDVKDKALLKCHFTGDYRNPKLEQIFQVLEFGIDLKVEEENGQYLVGGKGCK